MNKKEFREFVDEAVSNISTLPEVESKWLRVLMLTAMEPEMGDKFPGALAGMIVTLSERMTEMQVEINMLKGNRWTPDTIDDIAARADRKERMNRMEQEEKDSRINPWRGKE